MMPDREGTIPQQSRHESIVWPVALSLLAFIVAQRSPVTYTSSDPLGTLLTAQAVVRHGTIQLDRYAESSEPTYLGDVAKFKENRGKFRVKRDHIYHYAPLGTAALSVPFVWLESLRGANMLKPKTDAAVQNTLSAATVAISFIFVYLITRQLVSVPYSLVFSAGVVFGGPLMSTMGTALWSSNLAAVFVLAAFFLLVRSDREGTGGSGVPLGFVLFFAYLCRPASIAFVILVLILVGRRGKRQLLGAAAPFFALMTLFVGFSWSEFGTLLPDYYVIRLIDKPSRHICLILVIATALGVFLIATSRLLMSKMSLRRHVGVSERASLLRAGLLAVSGVVFVAVIVVLVGEPRIMGNLYAINKADLLNSLTAIYGLLLSPSRGLLVYSPFLLITVIGSVQVLRKKRTSPLFWLCVVWLVFHTLMLARPDRWHGGHCFGSRLFTEAFPAAIVLTLITWNSLDSRGRRHRRILRSSMLALMLLSIFTNTYQGLYNRYTTAWNAAPNIDSYPEYLFSWRYPQFLASPAQLEARNAAHQLKIRLRRRQEIDAAEKSSQAVMEGQRREME